MKLLMRQGVFAFDPKAKGSSCFPTEKTSKSVKSLLVAVFLLDDVEHLLDLLLLDLGWGLALSEPLSALGVLLDKLWGFGDDLAGWLGGLLGSSLWISTDGGVNLSPDIWDGLGLVGIKALGPVGELLLKSISTLLLLDVVPSLNVSAHDVFLVDLWVEFALLAFSSFISLLTTLVGDNLSLDDLEAWESLLGVWDLKTTIGGTLHGTEDTVTGGGADETDIEVGLEWSWTLLPLV